MKEKGKIMKEINDMLIKDEVKQLTNVNERWSKEILMEKIMK